MNGNLVVTLILFGIMLGTALLVRFLFFRKTKIVINKYFFYVSLIVIIASTILLYFQVEEFAEQGAKSSNSHTKGVVISSKVVGKRAIRPEVIYRFDVIEYELSNDTNGSVINFKFVDSNRYIDTTSLNPPMFGGKRKKLDVAEKLVAEYPAGKEVVVFYDQGNPQESFITHQITWDILAKLGFYAFLVLISSFCLMLPRKPKDSSV